MAARAFAAAFLVAVVALSILTMGVDARRTNKKKHASTICSQWSGSRRWKQRKCGRHPACFRLTSTICAPYIPPSQEDPTKYPTAFPTAVEVGPSDDTPFPTPFPTRDPTAYPTDRPTERPTTRTPTTRFPTRSPTERPTSVEEPDALCSDECRWANDGWCDDGGEGSAFSVCGFGSDCSDCGTRKTGPTTSPTPKPTVSPTPRPTGGAGGASEFSIDVVFSTPVSAQVEAAFSAAARRWSEVIVGDLSDNNGFLPRGTEVCGGWSETELSEDTTWDDVLIVATIDPIDGPGKVLGFAGPCRVDSAGMVRAGGMTFDADDVDSMLQTGSLETVILHEMGHVLGIGTRWEAYRLLREADGAAPLSYVGRGGISGLAAVGGSGEPVVEEDGGAGTARGHWDETAYEGELMTGYVGSGYTPLSALTAFALRDLGYEVSGDKVDSYTIPARRGLRAEGHAEGGDAGAHEHGGVRVGADVAHFPILPVETRPKT